MRLTVWQNLLIPNIDDSSVGATIQRLRAAGSDQGQGLARELIPSIAYADLPPLIERLFEAYVGRRASDESFFDFSRRHSIDELQSFLTPIEAIAR